MCLTIRHNFPANKGFILKITIVYSVLFFVAGGCVCYIAYIAYVGEINMYVQPK